MQPDDPDPAAWETAGASLTFTVGRADTAAALGSGDLPVLATPRVVAWCEAATCRAAAPHLPPGATTVGTGVTLSHLAASALGRVVRVEAMVTEVEGRRITFEVEVSHDDELRTGEDPDRRVVARGTVVRSLVDAERFVARLRA